MHFMYKSHQIFSKPLLHDKIWVVIVPYKKIAEGGG
jgi:hypothetical protein